MWINIGTIKEENKVWVEWFAKEGLNIHVANGEHLELSDHSWKMPQEFTNFLLAQLQNKAKADLKKSKNPTELAKTWKPTFGRVKKSNIEKLADEIKKLSVDDRNELKGLF